MATVIDNSSAAEIVEPVGNTYRGIGSSWFNARNVADEDWQREQQAADLAAQRAMEAQTAAQNFNAAEAQKQRDFEARMSSTQYQRAVEDMKAAGLNPVLAYSQGGSSSSSGSSASASPVSPAGSASGSSSSQDPLGQLVNGLVRIGIGYLTSDKPAMVAGVNDVARSFNSKGVKVSERTYSRTYHYKEKK